MILNDEPRFPTIESQVQNPQFTKALFPLTSPTQLAQVQSKFKNLCVIFFISIAIFSFVVIASRVKNPIASKCNRWMFANRETLKFPRNISSSQ
jgi:hypothetical protein